MLSLLAAAARAARRAAERAHSKRSFGGAVLGNAFSRASAVSIHRVNVEMRAGAGPSRRHLQHGERRGEKGLRAACAAARAQTCARIAHMPYGDAVCGGARRDRTSRLPAFRSAHLRYLHSVTSASLPRASCVHANDTRCGGAD
eukprot:IDg19962t1